MSAPMTPERLAEIRARVEAATEGPWEADNDCDPGVWGPEHIIVGHYAAHDDMDTSMWEDGSESDREFIAAARTDVGDLLAEVERAREALAAEPTDAEVEAGALREAANAWTQGAWADAPRRAERAQERIATAQHVGDWLRERAERIENRHLTAAREDRP